MFAINLEETKHSVVEAIFQFATLVIAQLKKGLLLDFCRPSELGNIRKRQQPESRGERGGKSITWAVNLFLLLQSHNMIHTT